MPEPIRLPLFPLSSVVLFPQTRVPLHIFEERYRQMMSEALDADRMLGIVTLLPDQAEEMPQGPPIFPVGCAGFISQHELLADGRYDLTLQGTGRFRILRQLPANGERLYRVAEVAFLEEEEVTDVEAEQLSGLRRQVLGSLERLARRNQQQDDLVSSLQRLGSLDDASFTNSLCAVIGLPTLEKQGLLEADGVTGRLERLEGMLRFHLAETGAAGGGSGALH